MNHTKQSKLHSQSGDIWFKKTNYPGEWLSKKSKDIINQINQKNMKNLLFTLLLLFPLMSFGQLDYKRALTFQNDIRSFHDLNKLKYDNSLAESAKVWAIYLAETNKFEFSDDDKGELIYYYKKRENIKIEDYLLDASIGWAIKYNEEETFKQIICEDCEYIGFGIAENIDYIYVVARYNKLYN
jgi:hypothetical protein